MHFIYDLNLSIVVKIYYIYLIFDVWSEISMTLRKLKNPDSLLMILYFVLGK